MTIKEIIKNKYVKWADVKKSIKYHYPDDKSNYEKLFNSIPKMRVKKVEKDEFLSVQGGVDYTSDWFKKDGKKFYLDSLVNGDDVEYYNVGIEKKKSKMSYACSFMSWGKMINYPIEVDTFKHLTMIDIVAHFLWEITFYGNEKQMMKISKEINGRVVNLKKEIEKEGKCSKN